MRLKNCYPFAEAEKDQLRVPVNRRKPMHGAEWMSDTQFVRARCMNPAKVAGKFGADRL